MMLGVVMEVIMESGCIVHGVLLVVLLHGQIHQIVSVLIIHVFLLVV